MLSLIHFWCRNAQLIKCWDIITSYFKLIFWNIVDTIKISMTSGKIKGLCPFNKWHKWHTVINAGVFFFVWICWLLYKYCFIFGLCVTWIGNCKQNIVSFVCWQSTECQNSCRSYVKMNALYIHVYMQNYCKPTDN